MVNKADFTVFVIKYTPLFKLKDMYQHDTHHCPSLKTCINMIHTTVQA